MSDDPFSTRSPIEAAEGYCDLGLLKEGLAEPDSVTPEESGHPAVLLMR